jgi:Zn-dependent M28 family amino/carboxypeptidase
MDLVREQTALGPRVPGTPPHDALRDLLARRLEGRADQVVLQPFPVSYLGRTAECCNVIGIFRAGPAPPRPPLLLATHYDTRPTADREREKALRALPIPGANDGGSGTAVLQHMLGRIRGEGRDRDVVVAFLDAEDLGNIGGNPFSIGAGRLAAHWPPAVPVPSEVVALDMVGGADMVLDRDAHALHHEASLALTRRLFRVAAGTGAAPFTARKPQQVKYIISDHWPFLMKGIASCILIDIDYPQWHTHADLPEAMTEESLRAIEEALSLFLSQTPD